MAENRDHYALVVGIDDYPDYRSLKGAKRDAEEFADWLLDKNIGGGLPDGNLHLVLSKKNPVRPVHDDIDDALEQIFSAVRGNGAHRIYLYFSGHGLARSSTGTDLCLAKWSKMRKGKALDSEDYLRMIKDSGHFKEVVMLLDCCRIRKIRNRALPPTIDPPKPGEGTPDSRTFVGYATEFLNAAFEASADEDLGEDDDLESQEIVRGHFTRALIQALKGNAAEAAGGVTASRLKSFLEIKTQEIAQSAGHTQVPEVANGLPTNPEPIFGSARPTTISKKIDVLVTFADSRVGEVILEDGDLDEVKRGNAEEGSWALRLMRGNYLLRDVSNDDESSLRITGEEAGTVNVNF